MCQSHLHSSSSLLLPLRRLRKTYYASRSPPLSGRKGGHEAHLIVYGQGSLSGDSEPLKSLHSESRLASNSWKSFRRARLPRRLRYLRLSLNKPLGVVKDVDENDDEDEVKQEMKQEVIKLQAFQTA